MTENIESESEENTNWTNWSLQSYAFYLMALAVFGQWMFEMVFGFSTPNPPKFFINGLLFLMASLCFALHTGMERSKLSFFQMGLNFILGIGYFILAIGPSNLH